MMLSCEYMPISWSARMSNRRQVASSDPVAKAHPDGKNCRTIDVGILRGNRFALNPQKMAPTLWEKLQNKLLHYRATFRPQPP